MPEMIQVNDLVTFECPHCGYITKGKRGEKINCPKCQPDFKGYILGAKNTEQQVQPDNGGMCTRPDMVDCHAKVGTGGRCMNVVPCPPLQVKS